MQYRQNIVTRKLLFTLNGVNYYLNSNHTKYLAQTLRPIFYVLENFHRKLRVRILWRLLPTELQNV